MASMQADRDFVRHRRFIGWGIAAFLFLIGVAIVIGAIVRAIVGPGAGVGYFPFFFFPFGFFIFVFFLFFLFRGLFWGGGGWGWRGYPMYGRYHYGQDDAAEILPRRYASGEITKDQVDPLMRDIGQSQPARPATNDPRRNPVTEGKPPRWR